MLNLRTLAITTFFTALTFSVLAQSKFDQDREAIKSLAGHL